MGKEGNKSIGGKGLPGVILLIVISIIMILTFQNFSADNKASVSFSYQLEHLVNLDLIDVAKSKKVSLNDNLVTFSGKFHDSLPENAKERYRFLSLLDQNHVLTLERTRIVANLDLLEKEVTNASMNFLQLVGLRGGENGFVVVPKSFDSLDRVNHIIIKDIPVADNSATLPVLKRLLKRVRDDSNNMNVSDLGNSLYLFVQSMRSSKIGIGDENIKNKLSSIEQDVSIASLNKDLSNAEKIGVYSNSIGVIESIVQEMFAAHDGVKLYGLRSVRNYLESIDKFANVVSDYNKTYSQLDKARTKVSNVIWFFNNQEISTKSLMSKGDDEYHQWFIQAEKEWTNFPNNKGLEFTAPDQPRNLVLEKTFKSEEPNVNYLSYIFTFLPIIMVAVLLYFIFSKQMKGVGSGAMNFGKSPAKMLNKGTQKITFDDVAGIDEAKEELEEVVDFLRDHSRFTKLGARIPKGVLLVGPPGTGKTLLAKAIAGEASVPFYSISGSDFVEMFVGVGASRVRDLFDQAKKSAPCIIFVDEIDAVGRHRGSGLGGGHDEREQTLNQLLVEIDGMESSSGVILIAATNRPDVLDKALLRPGRFDRNVYIDLPDYAGRLSIIKVHVRKVKMSEDVNLKELANRTAGLAGADLENIINEAALFAARKRRPSVIQEDIRYASEKVQFGKARKSMILDEKDILTTSWHEAGHSLVSIILKTSDKVNKVSRIPRGRSVGQTLFELKTNRVNYTEKELKDQLVVAMGGRVAEEIVNDNDPSNGAQMDIKMATSIARSMVCEWGMSEKIGMVHLSDEDNQSLMAGFQEREYSDQTAFVVDQEIARLVKEAYVKARQILDENYDQLKLIAEMLVEFETLEREDLDSIVDGTWSPETKRKQIQEFDSVHKIKFPKIPKELKKKKTYPDNPEPQT